MCFRCAGVSPHLEEFDLKPQVESDLSQLVAVGRLDSIDPEEVGRMEEGYLWS